MTSKDLAAEPPVVTPLLSELGPVIAELQQRFVGWDTSRTVWLGYSGGLDSAVLLSLLVAADLPCNLRAIHVNHGLSTHAADWQAHCLVQCEQAGVPCDVRTVSVSTQGRGLEDAARQARYQVFAEVASAQDVFLTAHHATDQAETLLLRLLRGCGVAGLKGVLASRRLNDTSDVTLWRPLLHYSRVQLEAYAKQQSLVWVDDDSNTDERFDRNYLRRQVLPVLSARWPEFEGRWQQTAADAAEQAELLQEAAAEWLPALQPKAERVGHSINLSALMACSPAKRRALMRHWLQQLAVPVPERVHLQEIEQQLLSGREGAGAQVCWSGYQLCRFQQRLYCLPALPKIEPLPNVWRMNGVESILQTAAVTIVARYCGGVTAEGLQAESLNELTQWQARHWQVRWRTGGERCQPETRPHSQTLKKLLLEAKLEPWLRDRTPLIYCDGELVAVAGLWRCRIHSSSSLDVESIGSDDGIESYESAETDESAESNTAGRTKFTKADIKDAIKKDTIKIVPFEFECHYHS